VVELRRDVDVGRPAVVADAGERARDRCGGVDDHDVARLEQVREIVEAAVVDAVRTRDEQTYPVAGNSAPLGWDRRLACRWKLERHAPLVEDAHAVAGARSLAR
jgi:hypothetical protein